LRASSRCIDCETKIGIRGALYYSTNDMSQPQSSDWLIDSRGGTRTRDPGTMSENAKTSKREPSSDDAA